MNWKREKPGVYTAGPYQVEQIAHTWYASGPGLGATVGVDRKEQAQGMCCSVAGARAMRSKTEPVVHDVVLVGERRGQISSIMLGDRKTLYSIKFVRGKRLCLFRHEFQVIVP